MKYLKIVVIVVFLAFGLEFAQANPLNLKVESTFLQIRRPPPPPPAPPLPFGRHRRHHRGRLHIRLPKPPPPPPLP